MKFEVFWATGNEVCTNCGEEIRDERFVRLLQNRWAKPSLCISCLRELLDIALGKAIPENTGKNIKEIVEVTSISKNGWMGA